jgi:hypothetical protein
MVLEHWPAICDVAAELLRVGRIDGARPDKIIVRVGIDPCE